MDTNDQKLEKIARNKTETENIASAIENLAGLQTALAHCIKGIRDCTAVEEAAAEVIVSIRALGFVSKDDIVPLINNERVKNLVNTDIDQRWNLV